MKRQSVAWIVVFIFILQFSGIAQENAVVIDAMRLRVNDRKTTNVIFPYAIKSIDRGSPDLLVQKASGVENVLQVKAAMPAFAETNLTVMTADGRFYSFVLNYESHPSLLNLRMIDSNSADNPIVVFNPDETNDKVRTSAKRLLNKKGFIKYSKSDSYGISLSLKGIYADGDMLYLQIGLENNSWLDYPIRQLRLFVRDKKAAKRTASQEVEITPTYILGDQKVLYNRTDRTIVIAIPSFTIPEKKKLLLQMQEAGGGRHLQLAIKNRQLTKAWRVY